MDKLFDTRKFPKPGKSFPAIDIRITLLYSQAGIRRLSASRDRVRPMRQTKPLIFMPIFLAISIGILSTTWAQEGGQDIDLFTLKRTDRISIQRLAGPVELDGRLNENSWKAVRSLPLIMMSPRFGDQPSEQSTVLVAYDDDHVYVGAVLFESEPDKIQATTKKRDAMTASTDWFGVFFDTFNDKENALAFFTTPSGLRFDAHVFNDARLESPTDMPVNLSWNTFWDVAVVRHEMGWSAEMRIPLSSLRFQDSGGRVVMGLAVFRWIAHKNEEAIFPAIPPNWGQMSVWKASQFQEVEFEGLVSRRPLYVTPYLLAGRSKTNELNEEETEYLKEDKTEFNVGLDVKYGLTSNLTLDLTVNTDFAQVEADDVQVNLTRFSLFFPEKRLFFQERSSNFEFSLGGQSRLFYSRRIGLHEDEDKIVPIYGGIRLVGRLGGWDVGFLDMQTAPLGDLSSENFGVLRLRRRIFNPYSYVGGMVTSRIGADGVYNVAYGLDGIFRLFGDDYLSFDFAQTYETDAANRVLSLDPTRLGLNWERRTQRGLGYSFSFSRIGPDFNPGMGFLMRENYTRFGMRWLYGWFPGDASPLFSHDVFLDGALYVGNFTKRVESFEFGPGWEFSSKSGWAGTVSPKVFYEEITEEFELSDDAFVPVGKYSFAGLSGFVQMPPGNYLSGVFILDAGSFYDGYRISLGFMPQWTIVPDLELTGMLQWNQVWFPGRDQRFLGPLGQIRLLATLTTEFSASALVQYSADDDQVVTNIRLRFNPREGTDIYLVYNDGLNTDRAGKFPFPPRTSARALLVKVNYTFNF